MIGTYFHQIRFSLASALNRHTSRLLFISALIITPTIIISAQNSPTPPPVLPSLLSFKGSVEKIEMARGQGPAVIEIKTREGKQIQVLLGPVRFLIQKGFNLTVRDEVEVQAFEASRNDRASYFAVEIRNLSQNQRLKLRDEQLRPLWRGGQYGRRGQGPP